MPLIRTTIATTQNPTENMYESAYIAVLNAAMVTDKKQLLGKDSCERSMCPSHPRPPPPLPAIKNIFSLEIRL